MRRQVTSENLRPEAIWPESTPFFEAAIATAVAIVVSFQHHAGMSTGAVVVVAFVPALVWVTCALTHRPPFLVRAAIIIAAVGILLTHPTDVDVAPFFLVLLIGEAVAVAPLWQNILVSAACVGMLVGFDIFGHYNGSYVWIFGFGFTWMGVSALQSRLRLVQTLSERAVFEERQRIARELHDVIAHSLAVTMLHLTGARLALKRDPADAEHALLEAERLGRQSLAEIRRTIGVLAPGDLAAMTAMPTAADIPDLVREVSNAGLEVAFDCAGDLDAIPTTAGLSMYRIVQESLANVVKHAPGSAARVLVCVGDDDVRIDVDNAYVAARTTLVRDDGGGMGLLLMRERAELLGGTVQVGPKGDMWRVEARIPKQLPA